MALEVGVGPLSSIEFYQVSHREFQLHLTKLLFDLENVRNRPYYVKSHIEVINFEVEVEESEI